MISRMGICFHKIYYMPKSNRIANVCFRVYPPTNVLVGGYITTALGENEKDFRFLLACGYSIVPGALQEFRVWDIIGI